MTAITFLEKQVMDLEAHIRELEIAFDAFQNAGLRDASEAFTMLEQAFYGRRGKKTMKRISSPTKKMKTIKEK